MKTDRIEKALDAAHRMARRASQTAAALVAAASLVSAALVTAYQAFHWLRWGNWEAISCGDLIPVSPQFLSEWVGARRVLAWALHTPIQAGLICGGLLAAWVCTKAADFLDP